MNNTIYHCLTNNFWIQRKCWECQQMFTLADCQTQNYYLTFQEILKVYESQAFPLPRDNACFDGVLVKLFHKQCPLFTTFTQHKELTLAPPNH